MTTYEISTPTDFTTHAALRMIERRVTAEDLVQAAADVICIRRQAHDRLEVFGANGITYISDLTGRTVVTVFPSGGRPAPTYPPAAGRSRHVPGRRGPKTRSDARRPR